METQEIKFERQLQYWTIAGPFVVAATLLLLLLKSSGATLILPFVALIGIPLCWIGQTRGLYFSLLLLAIAFFFVPSGSPFWHLGVLISLALSFVITALTSAELESQLCPEQAPINNEHEIELQNRLDQIENEHLEQAKLLDHELSENRNLLQKEKHLNELMQKELQEIRNKLQDANSNNKKLSEQAQKEQNAHRQMVSEINVKLDSSVREKGTLEKSLSTLQAKLDEQKQQILNIERLKKSADDEKIALQNQLQKLTDEQKDAANQLQEENRLHRRIAGMHNQLKEQFETKSTQLDETRRELFTAQESILQLQKDLAEAQSYLRTEETKDFEQHLIRTEREHSEAVRDYTQEIEALYELIATLQSTKQ